MKIEYGTQKCECAGGYFMKYEMLLGIFIVVTFLTAVKLLSDIKSNRMTEYIPLCFFVAILSALSAAAGVARVVECYIFKSYSLIRFFAVMLATVSFQIWLSIINSRIKQNRDEDKFEIYKGENKYAGNNVRKEELKRNLRIVK